MAETPCLQAVSIRARTLMQPAHILSRSSPAVVGSHLCYDQVDARLWSRRQGL